MRLKRLIGLEQRPKLNGRGELIVMTCPNGHRLSERDVLEGEPNVCPVCGVLVIEPSDLDPGEDAPQEGGEQGEFDDE
jgi:hypothetical protein